MKIDEKEIYLNLHGLRKAYGYTQKEFAGLVGISDSIVRTYENKALRYDIKLSYLLKILQCFPEFYIRLFEPYTENVDYFNQIKKRRKEKI